MTVRLSRFLLYGRWIRSDGTLRPDCFLPYREATSVFQTETLSEAEVWAIGETIADGVDHASLQGRGDIAKKAVEAAGLEFVRDDEPQYHGDIVGWPEDTRKHKALARRLADGAGRALRPPAGAA